MASRIDWTRLISPVLRPPIDCHGLAQPECAQLVLLRAGVADHEPYHPRRVEILRRQLLDTPCRHVADDLLALEDVAGRVHRTLEMTRVDSRLRTFDSEEEAVESFDRSTDGQ